MNLYDAVGLDRTVAYYNTEASIDGQWYVFMADENHVTIAHPTNPDLLGVHGYDIVGPNDYPSGQAVVISADEDGEWFSYPFANLSTGGMDMKHAWMVRHDGILFGSGWYEPGPRKSDPPAYTQAFVARAMNLYDAVGLDSTVAYYNTEVSIDGQWYVFIANEDDVLISHAANPALQNEHASVAVGRTAIRQAKRWPR